MGNTGIMYKSFIRRLNQVDLINIKSFLLLFFVVGFSKLSSQCVDPVYTPFEGQVYKMPITLQKKGKYTFKRIQEYYSPDVYEYEVLNEISLEDVSVPETTIGLGSFPGVDATIQFAMILESEMSVLQEACYEISLNSDDGSILWLNGTKVLDNDGGHQMEMKKDSLVLLPGDYAAKLWYFQGMPDRFGLELNIKCLGDTSLCNKELQTSSWTLDGDVFFEKNSFELNDMVKSQLNDIAVSMRGRDIKYVSVVGYASQEGSTHYNLKLSQDRADAVKQYLLSAVKEAALDIRAEGKGEMVASKEGLEKQRRVEITLVEN